MRFRIAVLGKTAASDVAEGDRWFLDLESTRPTEGCVGTSVDGSDALAKLMGTGANIRDRFKKPLKRRREDDNRYCAMPAVPSLTLTVTPSDRLCANGESNQIPPAANVDSSSGFVLASDMPRVPSQTLTVTPSERMNADGSISQGGPAADEANTCATPSANWHLFSSSEQPATESRGGVPYKKKLTAGERLQEMRKRVREKEQSTRRDTPHTRPENKVGDMQMDAYGARVMPTRRSTGNLEDRCRDCPSLVNCWADTPAPPLGGVGASLEDENIVKRATTTSSVGSVDGDNASEAVDVKAQHEALMEKVANFEKPYSTCAEKVTDVSTSFVERSMRNTNAPESSASFLSAYIRRRQ